MWITFVGGHFLMQLGYSNWVEPEADGEIKHPAPLKRMFYILGIEFEWNALSDLETLVSLVATKKFTATVEFTGPWTQTGTLEVRKDDELIQKELAIEHSGI